MLEWILLPLLLIAPLLYYIFMRNQNYWKKRGVPYIKPLPIFGNLKSMILLQKSPGQMMAELYNSTEAKNQRFLGIFIWNCEPAVLLRDPELIKHVFVKDFSYFNNRNVQCDPINDPIGHNNLFVLRDKKWKYVRAKLTPTFTSGKMKQMFRLIHGVAVELIKNIENRRKLEDVFDIRKVASAYTTDVISTCAFGIQSNVLTDPNAIFGKFGKMIFENTIRRSLETRSFFFMHWWSRFSGAIFLHKQSSEFFRKVFWDVFKKREEAGTSRNDFIDTLIQLKRESSEKFEQAIEDKDIFEFDGDSLVAQSVLFFTAGFETTSLTISYALTELAVHPEIQEKLRKEIAENFRSHEDEISYEGLFEMKYMEKVVSEVLRKYPPMAFIDRICTQDYKVPDSELIIQKGTPVFLSLYQGLHYDPEIYPNPEEFDPERFSSESKSTRHPFAYIPFGEGPHICIGMRFALMNVKTALSAILLKYRVVPTEKITMPLETAPRPILTTSERSLALKFIPL